jgi:hypothetical protein
MKHLAFVAALSSAAVASPALADFIAPGGLPGSGGGSSSPVQQIFSRGGSSAGAGVVGGFIVYIGRGMIGVAVIGATEERQATPCEFLTWPMPICEQPKGDRLKYLRLALRYQNLSFVKEQAWMNGGIKWPATFKELQAMYRDALSNPLNH